MMPNAKRHRRIRLVVVVILDLDLHPAVVRQVRPVERIHRKRAFPARNKPLRMLDHPVRIDAHMVRHHVARQPDPEPPRPVAQALVPRIAPQVLRNPVLLQRVSRGHGIRMPPQPLDLLRSRRPLPQPNQPQRRHPPVGQQLQFFIRNLVQPMNMPQILLRELLQPHIRALRHHHHVRHPRLVRAENASYSFSGAW